MHYPPLDHSDPAALAQELEKLRSRVDALEALVEEIHRRVERIEHEHEHDHHVLERIEHDPYTTVRKNITVGL